MVMRLLLSTYRCFHTLFLLFVAGVSYANNPSEWHQVKKEGKGEITVYWYDSNPFVFVDEGSQLKGIEYDIVAGFVDYLKERYGVSVKAKWIRSAAFLDAFNEVKNTSVDGVFGVSAFSITTAREKDVAFSHSYMADMAVLVTSRNIPVANNEETFRKTLSKLTAITIAGTAYEKELLALRNDQNVDFAMEYIASSDNILKTIAARENAFGYIDLPIYLTNLKDMPNSHVVRQSAFPVKRKGYGIILPKESSWLIILNEYLTSTFFHATLKEILGRYLQQDVYQVIMRLSSGESVNADEEILLLTKEKEVQHQELMESALKNQREDVFMKVLIVAFLVAVTIIIFLYQIYRSKIRANRELFAHKTKIEQQQQNIEAQKTILENRNNSLTQLNEEKNNLINVLAHDLRAPINQIEGLAMLYKMENNTLKEEQLFSINTILKSAKRVNEMISKILDVDAIESQKLNLKTEPIAIGEILSEVVEEFSDQAKTKSIQLIYEAQDEVSITGDRVYLRQIFANLISNAIKFSHPGTNVYVSIQQEGHNMKVVVKDEGPGFTKQDLALLFKKFQRLSARPTGGEQSTGLGLSIVKKYTELMNGSIFCDSELGKGASFSLLFPKAETSASSVAKKL